MAIIFNSTLALMGFIGGIALAKGIVAPFVTRNNYVYAYGKAVFAPWCGLFIYDFAKPP
ncbi:MAG: hypothetical protein LBC56_01165 [Oscillospiraceae bacterium]|jgi:hypothetical protein|nr:hypothetical protein [Oscillospiraceae bacterium]